MERIKQVLLEISNPILAGIMISIGCLVNLSCNNKYIRSYRRIKSSKKEMAKRNEYSEY